jgi:hypothetical protein
MRQSSSCECYQTSLSGSTDISEARVSTRWRSQPTRRTLPDTRPSVIELRHDQAIVTEGLIISKWNA